MRRNKFLRKIHGAVLWSMIAGVSLASIAQAKIQLPFTSGEIWYVCRGYNVQNTAHQNAPALDFTTDSHPSINGGCNPIGKDSSVGKLVVAPANGKISAWGDDVYQQSDQLCIDLDQGGSLWIGHLVNRAPLGKIKKGDPIGNVAKAGELYNNGYAHIHIQAHPVAGCPKGNLIPFTGDMAFEVVGDLTYDGSPNQHAGLKVTNGHMPGYLGSLVRLMNGDGKVYLVSFDGVNIVKRLINPAAFDVNSFNVNDIVDVEQSVMSSLLKGADITSRPL